MVAFIRRAVCPIVAGDARFGSTGLHTGPMDIPDELLAPAVAAVRRALDELDGSEIPARLRRVAASSARQLPAPLRRSVLGELDTSEWMRARARECLDDGDEPATRVSLLFLERPAGWEEEVRGIVEEVQARHEQRTERRWREAVERLEGELQREREALRRVREEMADRVAEAEAEAKAAAADRLRRFDRRARELGEEVARLRAELDRVEGERDRLEAELAESDRRLADLRDRLRRRRRVGEDPSGGYGWSLSDPFELARDLDRLVAALETGPESEEGTEREAPAAPTLPGGLRPDEGSAIEWVRGRTIPMVLVVDGYNVAFELADGQPDEAVLRRLEGGLRRLWRTAEGPLRIVVFYDSGDTPDSVSTPGVEIRYVPDADDAVVDAAASASVPAVVVSSDRRVREGAEAVGAIALWSEALAEWIDG